MVTTPVSLLKRLQSGSETQSWDRFVRLYTPLIYGWARAKGIDPSEAADVVQEVFAVLVRKLPTFQYDPAGGFGSWLRTITVNKCRDLLRRRAARPAQTNIDPAPADADAVADLASGRQLREQSVESLSQLLGWIPETGHFVAQLRDRSDDHTPFSLSRIGDQALGVPNSIIRPSQTSRRSPRPTGRPTRLPTTRSIGRGVCRFRVAARALCQRTQAPATWSLT